LQAKAYGGNDENLEQDLVKVDELFFHTHAMTIYAGLTEDKKTELTPITHGL